MKRDREIIASLARAIAEIAAGRYRWAATSAKEALEALEAVCSQCGRPWSRDMAPEESASEVELR